MSAEETTAKPVTWVWFVTGTSTGFGRLLAEAVLARGDYLAATVRRPEQLDDLAKAYSDQLLVLPLEVTDEAQCQQAATQAVERFGRIDVLVNNAGFGMVGAIEETSQAETRHLFETNVFGLLNVTRAMLPILRKQRHGHILMLSSVGGFTGSIGAGIYNASKFAVEGLSEALAQEVAPLGIKLIIVEPGYFRTDFAGRSLSRAQNEIADYAQTSGLTRQRMTEVNGNQPGDPKLAVQAMIKIVETPAPPLRLALGADALARIRGKLASVAQEIDRWEETSLSTGYKEATAK